MWAKRYLFCLAILLAGSAAASDAPAVFDTPQKALDTFAEALTDRDRDEMHQIFGADADDLLSTGDPEQDRDNRALVLDLLKEGYRFQPDEDRVILVLGAEGWPFPIPLGRVDGGWQFDVETGREEILARRIGLNELEVLVLLELYVDLQSEFRRVDHDGDGVMEFAQAIIAEPGARDGLFWPEGRGFIGEALARAAAEGWSDGESDRAPEPFNGYYFRVLQGQTDNAPGGATSYFIGDNMVAGHAILAVPAVYGDTGITSFMVSENGLIFESDLGPDTLDKAAGITAYDPGPDWRLDN